MELRISSTKLWSLLLVVVLCTVSGLGDSPCQKKWVDGQRMVCVCNATYCDTLDPVPTLSQGQFVQYTSDIAGLRFHRTLGQFSNTPNSGGLQMAIDDKMTYQSILGFGTAFTDAAGLNMKALSLEAQENLLKSYFSPQGIELNFGRVPIGGCDFSTHTYAYDEVKGDLRLEHFNLTMEDFVYKIPLIKRAMALSQGKVRLIGAAWSPPPWMKTNNDYSGFGFLKSEYYETWANYHIKFLDAYEREGLTFWAISTGNEPTNGVIPVNRFNSLGWKPSSQLRWVRENLGPAVRGSRHRGTLLLAADDQRFMLPFWVYSMKSDLKASQYIDGIAVHWYWDLVIPPYFVDFMHKEFPNKFILSTEACVGDKPWEFQKVLLGSWERGESYMANIIQNLNHWVTGWVDWNLALDEKGGPNWAKNFVDSAVIVNATGDEFYKQPMFYALGHFSKFVAEGSVRVSISPTKSHGVQSIAFRTPNNAMVIILFNRNYIDHQLTITDPHRGHINVLLTRKSFHTLIYT